MNWGRAAIGGGVGLAVAGPVGGTVGALIGALSSADATQDQGVPAPAAPPPPLHVSIEHAHPSDAAPPLFIGPTPPGHTGNQNTDTAIIGNIAQHAAISTAAEMGLSAATEGATVEESAAALVPGAASVIAADALMAGVAIFTIFGGDPNSLVPAAIRGHSGNMSDAQYQQYQQMIAGGVAPYDAFRRMGFDRGGKQILLDGDYVTVGHNAPLRSRIAAARGDDSGDSGGDGMAAYGFFSVA